MKIKSNTSLSLRKFLLSVLVAAPLATLPAPLWALPQTTGGNVTSSSATTSFQTNSPINTVLSITDPVATRLVLRWTNFGSGTSDIPAGSTIIWNLPSSTSAALNTVTTGGTLIDGALQSNGSIFILNPNGIVLGNTATVTAAGFGLSTISEPEFFFVNNGVLGFTGTTPTADVTIGTATINVGTTGKVFVAGRNASVSGTITAGELNVSSNTGGVTGVTLGGAGALTLGVAGVPTITGIEPSVAGTGNLIVNTNGGPLTLGPNLVSVLGGNATITTGGGNISQVLNTVGQPSFTGGAVYTVIPTVTVSAPTGANPVQATAVATIDTVATSPTFGRVNSVTITNSGSGYIATPTITVTGGGAPTTIATVTAPVVGGLFSVGDTVSNSNLTLNTGSGTVTLSNLSGNGQRNNVTLNTGVTTIMTNWGAPSFGITAPSGRIAIGGTVTGNGTGAALTVVAGGSSLDSLSDTTVTGGSISLTTLRDNQGMTFKGPGDLTFSTLVTRPTTGSGVTLTSTTGAIVLPAATIGGNITITAQTNISQSGDLINTQVGGDASVTRTASFDAVTGTVTLTSAGNDFTRLVIKNSPGGATVNDANSIILAGGTNSTGSVSLVAPSGVTLGHDATGTVFVNGDLNITTLSGTNSVQVTAGGSGFTVPPTVTLPAGTGTAVLGIDAITAPTVPGTGYVTAPSVTFTGGVGTGATGTTTLQINAITLVSGGSGFLTVPTIGFTAPPTGGTAPVAGTVNLSIPASVALIPTTSAGSGYLVAPTVSFTAPPAGGIAPTATANLTGNTVTSYTITGTGSGYLTTPSVTFTAAALDPGVGAAAAQTRGVLGAVTLASTGLGYATAPSVTVNVAGTGATALPALTTAGSVNTVVVTAPGTGFTTIDHEEESACLIR